MEGEAGLWVLVVTLLAAGLVLIIIGRKQRAGTLRRNWLAGLRTWETMRSDAAWHAAHAATAALVTAAGVVQCLTAVALALLRPGETTIGTVVLASAGITLVLMLAAAVRGHRIAARVNRHEQMGPEP